jgi:hypothetical protein
MKHFCDRCKASLVLNVTFKPLSFVCNKCFSVFVFDDNEYKRAPKLQKTLATNTHQFALKVGDEGIINNISYQVTGIAVKRVGTGADVDVDADTWIEYSLCSNNGKFVYLSEDNGHWVLLQKESDVTTQNPTGLEHFSLVNTNYSCTIMYAEGLFDYQLPKHYFDVFDYVNYPEIISIEEVNKVSYFFRGRHISRRELKTAFPNIILPWSIGLGMGQPTWLNYSHYTIITAFFALLIIITGIVDFRKTNVASLNVLADTTYREKLSSSFTLQQRHPSALTIYLDTKLDNSWMNVEIGLVNEKTNEVRYAVYDVEYYHGVEDKYHWEEGSIQGEFVICAVPAGTYHLTAAAFVADYTQNKTLNVLAVSDNYTGKNVIIALLFLGISAFMAAAAVEYWEANRQNV